MKKETKKETNIDLNDLKDGIFPINIKLTLNISERTITRLEKKRKTKR